MLNLSAFRFILPLALFLVLALLLWRGLAQDPGRLPSALVGKPVPAFSLTTLQDPEKELSEQSLHGKIALLNVWASWCYACALEHPLLMKLAQSKRVAVYGLNYRDERAQAKNWLQQHGDPFALTFFDGAGRVAIEWGVYGTPETYLIDQKGIIRYRHVGLLDARTWEQTLLPLIEQLEKNG